MISIMQMSDLEAASLVNEYRRKRTFARSQFKAKKISEAPKAKRKAIRVATTDVSKLTREQTLLVLETLQAMENEK